MTSLATHTFTEHEQASHTLRVRGVVQGVGFRPTVWRIANDLGLTGNVSNDGKGVLINLYCNAETLKHLKQSLLDECPPLARIDSIDEILNTDEITQNDFQIIDSTQTEIATGIIADAATCNDCLHELNDANDHRYRYPFLNCTHCGPRFSIIRQLPYDRANTSMSGFSLCDNCSDEYNSPTDRRFHAQPTACVKCGPAIFLCDNNGNAVTANEPIAEAAKQLKLGAIIAIKGIGGIHLACDASNQAAIAHLRQQKNRPHKPLALMAKNIEQVRRYCKVSEVEQEALSSAAAPIVILDTLNITSLPENIAPEQKQWGFMLPYSPLHHLLMAELNAPIVLTSGNLTDEPQCTDNDDALNRLNDIAELFLLHNRPIENRIDDSVVREMGGQLQVLRRARGYAPGHITLPAGFDNHPPLLAFGGELKSTFCLLKNGHAILSQHMGDLEDARTFDDYRKNLSLYLELYAHDAEVLAVDNHPEYLSTKLGIDWAEKKNLPLIEVQHHHAHIAACMLDNNIDLDEGPVIGVAFDGLGYGDDGTLWGGEFLLADYQQYKRLAHLKPVALPGAAQAMREPWRNTWAQLCTNIGWDTFTHDYSSLPLNKFLQQQPVKTLQKMLNKNINSPLSSSAGRLFDAIAAATGLAPTQCSYEGQAAMALEACIKQQDLPHVSPYPFELYKYGETYEIDATPMWQKLLDNLKAKTTASIIAARFHRGLAQSIIDTASLLASENNINRVALSGGVFQNCTLFKLVVNGLKQKNIQVLTHHQIPANDGGIALGQAVIAAAREIRRRK
jgi:hydrogenase maturation protein HypF